MLPERSIKILLESAGLLIWAWIPEELPKDVVPLNVGPDPVIRMPPRPVALWSAYYSAAAGRRVCARSGYNDVAGARRSRADFDRDTVRGFATEVSGTVPAAMTKMLSLVEVRLIALWLLRVVTPRFNYDAKRSVHCASEMALLAVPVTNPKPF